MSASKICPQCNAEYPLDQRFCPLDGSTLKTTGGSGDLVGSVVADRYYVMRKLGEGGMGQVYLAEHVRMGRKSALKVMHPSAVHDADAISRFNREAANASRISHPNVAAIYDFGETSEGLIYLAMEYVDGEPLTGLIERTGALPPLRAADIVRQAADALSVAHDMGIVHRDLKPDNIMLTRNRDGSDCVKVVDFGIAKGEGASQKVTRTGLIVGTPEYMSPEQLAGDKLDGRSDTYSLGLVAFQLLTGKLPFPSDSAQESMIMRLTERPRRLGDMRGEVAWPAELQAVLDRVLERDATLRYANAADFGRDFARAVERMPESAVATAGTVVMDGVVPPTVIRGGVADSGAIAGSGAIADSGLRGAEATTPSADFGLRTAEATTGTGGSGAATVLLSREPRQETIVAPRGRTPILIAATVLVVVGAGAAAMQMAARGEGGAGDSAAVARDTAATPAATVAEGAGGGKDVAGTSRATEPAPAGAGAGTPDGRGSGTPAAMVRPMGAAVTRPSGGTSATSTDVDAELAAILASIADERTAAGAVTRIDALAAAGRLPRGSEEHLWSQYARAQAYLFIGRETDGCAILAGLRGRSTRPLRNDAIDATFTAASCQ